MSNSEEELRERGLAFMGTINANFTHEINNVLATVNELSGLIDDILVVAERGSPLNPTRLRNTVGRISDQLRRGQRLVQQLNQFAHSVDDPIASLDCTGALGEVLALCERFANLKKATIKANLPDGPIPLVCSPFEIRHILFRCIEIALSASKAHDVIEVGLSEKDGGGLFSVCSQAIIEDSPEIRERLQFLSLLTDKYGAVLKTTPQPGESVSISVLLLSQTLLD